MISFEAWQIGSKLWVCVPLRIYLEPVNEELMLLVLVAQRENCAVPSKKHFGPMVCHISYQKY